MSTIKNRRWRSEVWPLGIVLLLLGGYFLSYFNRFLGLRSGDGEFGGGMVFLAGLRPYRDYYTAGPPLNQFKAALELVFFGKALIVSRLAAVAERLLLAGVLYAWLRRSFTVAASMLACFVTIVVSAGDRTDPLASYNHDAILFAMLCGLLASFSLTAKSSGRMLSLAAFAGVAASLSFLTKQTVGVAAMVSVLVFATMAVVREDGCRRALAWGGSYLLGMVAPAIAVGGYLYKLGVLRACVTMLFVTGPTAKASGPAKFLIREWTVADAYWMWLSLAVLALLLSGAAIWRATRGTSMVELLSLPRLIALIGAGCALVLLVCEAMARTSIPALENFGKISVYYAFFGCSVLGIAALITGVRAEGKERERAFQCALFAAVGWSVAASLSLSWPAFEAMTLPGLGLLLAAALDGTKKGGKRFLYLVISAMLLLQMREKLDLPFGFDHQDEPSVRFAIAKSEQPALRGMRLAPETVRLADDVVSLIHNRTRPEDTIFTYPEMGVLYVLGERKPPTWALSHNIDVVPDSFARAEAARLIAAAPAVVIYARPTESQLLSDEALWREGRHSGQRVLVKALDTIVAGYELTGTYQLTPDDNPIRVYVRR